MPVLAGDDSDSDSDDGAPPSATVQVDCAAGDSISKALENDAKELIVEISGICEEEVQVRRSNVTLRGTDPLVDGIRPAPDEPLGQALNLFGVHLVNIENLKLAGGRVGLGINNSFGVDVINCLVEDNSSVGVIFGTASGANDLVDTRVTGNHRDGIWVLNGSSLRCWGCTVDTPNTGIRLDEASNLGLSDSSVRGLRAILAFGGSRLFTLVPSSLNTIEGTAVAIRARGAVSVDLFNAAISGPVDLWQKSVATLNGTTQTVSSGLNRISSGSSLVAGGSTSLAGDFSITEFSDATFRAGATVSGSLSCGLGADAFCDDPIASVGGASDCGQCAKP